MLQSEQKSPEEALFMRSFGNVAAEIDTGKSRRRGSQRSVQTVGRPNILCSQYPEMPSSNLRILPRSNSGHHLAIPKSSAIALAAL